MVDLDKNEQNILSIDETTEMFITAHGKLYSCKTSQNSDESWDLKLLDSNEKSSYGLSCENIKELRALLLADYATGIITNIQII